MQFRNRWWRMNDNPRIPCTRTGCLIVLLIDAVVYGIVYLLVKLL